MPTRLARTKDDPWKLKTAPGTSEYTMHTDEKDGIPILVCTVGATVLHYDARCIDDLQAMLKKAGDWVELGGADEQKPAKEGTVEAWGRSAENPVGGWYGLKKGLRGRFGVYLPPLLKELGLSELEHNPRNNRIRASKPRIARPRSFQIRCGQVLKGVHSEQKRPAEERRGSGGGLDDSQDWPAARSNRAQ